MAEWQPESPTPMNLFFRRLLRPVLLGRVFFVLLVTYLGYLLRPVPYMTLLTSNENLFFTAFAFLFAVVVVLFEYATNIISQRNILQAAGGLLFGLITAYFFSPMIPIQVLPDHMQENRDLIYTACAAIFGYFGIILAVKHAERFQLSNLKFILSGTAGGPAFVLDTSAIIDGRITELFRMNILRGPLVVPQFVLNELQQIADSSDIQRRAKGRRGLETLETLREHKPDMRIWPQDYPDILAVDHKLIQLARDIQAWLVTNDINLEKVATLHRVNVLNMNELAQALRPPIFVGHTLHIDIVREGKEANQGIGYLDDGTMVVVEDGQKLIGSDADVTVSSILQTAAGRMVFSKIRSATNGKKPDFK